MAIVDKNIGSGGDYTTVQAFEDDIDNTTYPDAGTEARGLMLDEAFNESVVINAVASNVDQITLSVAEANRGKGIAGAGARFVSNGTVKTITISVFNVKLEHFEMDGVRSSLTFTGGLDVILCTSQDNINIENLLIHDFKGTGFVAGIRGGAFARQMNIKNCFIYGLETTSTGGIAVNGINSGGSNPGEIYNNTVFDLTTAGGGAVATGYFINGGAVSAPTFKNNIGMDCETNDFVYDLTDANDPVSESNMSSDATADDGLGSNHLINKTTVDQFKSIVAGSEDLHLKSGSDAILAGLGPSADSNVPGTDIDGDTRSGTTTDMGADLFISGTVAGPLVNGPIVKSKLIGLTN